MKKTTLLIPFFLLSAILASCVNFTPEPMTLDINKPDEQLDFCKDDPTKCLENTEPTFCEQYHGLSCCSSSQSDARCDAQNMPPNLTEWAKTCSKDFTSPWCPTYEMCISAEVSSTIYAACKAIIPYPTSPTYCGTRYQGSDPAKHNGLDVASNSGSLPTNDMPIYASWRGKVVKSWNDPVTVKDPKKGAGNLVVVEYKYDDIPAAQRPEWLKPGNSIYVRYAHLSDKDRIPLGEIEQGTIIGRVGSTGNSTGPHIHLETKSGTSDTYNTFDGIPMYHDPLDVFPGICVK